MDWHMYLILFIAMILFIGIVIFAERAKKQPKDPLSIWNPDNFSLYFGDKTKSHDARSYYLKTRNDTEFDPAFHNLPANVFHNFYHND